MKTSPNQRKQEPAFHVDENVAFEEQIAQRAHELWQQRKGEHGNDWSDWFRAEREISEWHHMRFKTEGVHNRGVSIH